MNLIDKISQDISKIEGRQTKLYRDIAKAYKKELYTYPIEEIYTLCETLLDTRNWAETIIAYQIIFDQKKKYDEQTFQVFEQWLFKYIQDWWDCDDFMTHAFQYVLMMYPKNLPRIKKWTSHERFAVRRSAAVILIVPSKKGLLKEEIIFDICTLLINDSHHLVQKGYGWLLKVASKAYHDSVIQYLENNVSIMPRTAFRYALENLPKQEKARLITL